MKQAERLSKKDKKDGPAQKLDKALDRADFKKAKEEMERLGKRLQAEEEVARLRKKMRDDKLTEEQKQEMREQLDKLKDQELSREQQEQLEKQLQDVKDKLERLTRSNEAKERLRELQRQGAISKEELDRELDQLERNMAKLDPQTLQELKELAEKLGECQKCMKEGKGDEAAQKMAEAAEKLARLDPNGESRELQQQLRQLQAARQAVCQALDGKPVPGAGQRPQSKEGETNSREEWAHSPMDKGRLQVIDHVPGDGFKGPRKPAEMTEDIRRASQEEPEAIDRQRLPRSASDMARGYFEKLRGPDKKPAEPRR
jgi:DNA repair exonuclease SbcCD ATPase subunit